MYKMINTSLLIKVLLFSNLYQCMCQINRCAYLKLDYKTQYLRVISKASETPSVFWDKIAQQLVKEQAIGPTRASNVYGTLHTAIYNSWSVYDRRALSSTHGGKLRRPKRERTIVNKNNAMNFAAFEVLIRLFPKQKKRLKHFLNTQLYPVQWFPLKISKRIGLIMAKATLKRYSTVKQTEKLTSKKPHSFSHSKTVFDTWSPERIPIDYQKGKLQKFLTPYWGYRKTFVRPPSSSFLMPKPPESFLLKSGYVNLKDKNIKLANGTCLPITKSLIGTVINRKYIEQAKKVIWFSKHLNDRSKMKAEFWEDGPGTSYPPGKWMTFAQYISARDRNNIDKDAKMFFVVGNSVRDAGIVAWESKLYYYYIRPIRSIRMLGSLGLLGKYEKRLRGNAITAYSRKHRRAMKILATRFDTYQTPGGESSPPFPEYVSGHSTFSGSSAAALELITRRNYFGGVVKIKARSSRFEKGKTPRKVIYLKWETFSKAAKEAGLSRVCGGIHFIDANREGLRIGRLIGSVVYKQSLSLFNRGKKQN